MVVIEALVAILCYFLYENSSDKKADMFFWHRGVNGSAYMSLFLEKAFPITRFSFDKKLKIGFLTLQFKKKYLL